MKTPTETPKVSIIIPTHNSAQTLKQCLQSIKNQTFKNWEIIVVDALSSDETVKIAKSFQAKVLLAKGLQSKARNIGVENSSGEFVLFLDSDQTLSSGVIDECLNKCLSGNAGMVRIPEVFVGKGFWSDCSAVWRNNYDNVEALYGNRLGLVHGKPRFFVRQLLLDVGLFDAALLWGEDYDLYERLKSHGVKEAFCSSVLHHFEAVSLRQFLSKNLRYGDSMPTFMRQGGKQGFSVMINHALLTFAEILKRPQRLSVVVGCAVLFWVKSNVTVLGVLRSRWC
jgi:glycosyltransferase involved in cell wall biosynthesis